MSDGDVDVDCECGHEGQKNLQREPEPSVPKINPNDVMPSSDWRG